MYKTMYRLLFYCEQQNRIIMSKKPKHNRQNKKRDHLTFLKELRAIRKMFDLPIFPKAVQKPGQAKKVCSRLKRVTRCLKWYRSFVPELHEPGIIYIHFKNPLLYKNKIAV